MDKTSSLHSLVLKTMYQNRGWSAGALLDTLGSASRIVRPDGPGVLVTRLYRQRSAPLRNVASACGYARQLAGENSDRVTLVINTDMPAFMIDALVREYDVEVIDGQALAMLASKGEFSTFNDIAQALDESVR